MDFRAGYCRGLERSIAPAQLVAVKRSSTPSKPHYSAAYLAHVARLKALREYSRAQTAKDPFAIRTSGMQLHVPIHPNILKKSTTAVPSTSTLEASMSRLNTTNTENTINTVSSSFCKATPGSGPESKTSPSPSASPDWLGVIPRHSTTSQHSSLGRVPRSSKKASAVHSNPLLSVSVSATQHPNSRGDSAARQVKRAEAVRCVAVPAPTPISNSSNMITTAAGTVTGVDTDSTSIGGHLQQKEKDAARANRFTARRISTVSAMKRARVPHRKCATRGRVSLRIDMGSCTPPHSQLHSTKLTPKKIPHFSINVGVDESPQPLSQSRDWNHLKQSSAMSVTPRSRSMSPKRTTADLPISGDISSSFNPTYVQPKAWLCASPCPLILGRKEDLGYGYAATAPDSKHAFVKQEVVETYDRMRNWKPAQFWNRWESDREKLERDVYRTSTGTRGSHSVPPPLSPAPPIPVPVRAPSPPKPTSRQLARAARAKATASFQHLRLPLHAEGTAAALAAEGGGYADIEHEKWAFNTHHVLHPHPHFHPHYLHTSSDAHNDAVLAESAFLRRARRILRRKYPELDFMYPVANVTEREEMGETQSTDEENEENNRDEEEDSMELECSDIEVLEEERQGGVDIAPVDEVTVEAKEEAWALLRALEVEHTSDPSEKLQEEIDEQRQFMTKNWGIEWHNGSVAKSDISEAMQLRALVAQQVVEMEDIRMQMVNLVENSTVRLHVPKTGADREQPDEEEWKISPFSPLPSTQSPVTQQPITKISESMHLRRLVELQVAEMEGMRRQIAILAAESATGAKQEQDEEEWKISPFSPLPMQAPVTQQPTTEENASFLENNREQTSELLQISARLFLLTGDGSVTARDRVSPFSPMPNAGNSTLALSKDTKTSSSKVNGNGKNKGKGEKNAKQILRGGYGVVQANEHEAISVCNV